MKSQSIASFIFSNVILLLLLRIQTTNSVHHVNWTRTEIMDSFGLYLLEWRVDNKEIIFTTTVNTRGFIGLGFSYRHGEMSGSDLVLAWVDDTTGLPNVLDCHGPRDGNGAPIQDDTQNYTVINGYQNATHTVIQFKRALETCDPDDVVITSDSIKVLWSYGEQDPIHGNHKGHNKNRGWKNMHLLGPHFKKSVQKDALIQQWDVTVKNITIDASMDTIYWCKIFRVPDLKEKHHIIGYEPLLTKESSTKHPLIHHMTLFECDSYSGSDPNAWDVWGKTVGAVCNSDSLTPHDWNSCITPIATWGMGGSGQFLPEHVGIPIGGRDSVKYYMLEIHYDNPHSKRILDHSGFRIHYTKKLREHEGGMLITGITVSETQMIPPGQKLYRNLGICGPSCTGAVFPETGIKIVSTALHSHAAGQKMKLRHVRDGKELDRIVEDDNYNHNFQEIYQLANETTILPGDYIITDCAYETLKRKRPTLGGYSTKQEVCLAFITYYPRINLASCYSMTPVKEFFENFGVHGFYGINMTDVENSILYNSDLDAYTTSIVFPNFPPGGDLNDRENRIAIEALKHAKEFSEVTEEEIVYKNSTLNKLIISDPAEFHERTFLTHLYQLPWHEPLFTRRVEQAILTGKHMTFCRTSNESISVPPEIFTYPNFTSLVKPASHCPYQQYFEFTLKSFRHSRI
uniref:CSON004817 protein n=1 Tax=Culicoides sonorensis TaxID=179676 RepID=A0A336L841_CULSO